MMDFEKRREFNLLKDSRDEMNDIFDKRNPEDNTFVLPVNISRLLQKYGIKTDNLNRPVELCRKRATDLRESVIDKFKNNIILKANIRSQTCFKKLLENNIHNHNIEQFFNELEEKLVDSKVPYGEMVGVLLGQSQGEIMTQKTLNSTCNHEELFLKSNNDYYRTTIGEFVDSKLLFLPETKKIVSEKNEEYGEFTDDLNIHVLSCDKLGNVDWKRIEGVSRHPVINEDGTDTLLSFITKTGRTVTVTKGESLLTLKDGKIQPCNASSLKIGDVLPVSNKINIKMEKKYLDLKDFLPENKFTYADNIIAINKESRDLKGNVIKRHPRDKSMSGAIYKLLSEKYTTPFPKTHSYCRKFGEEYEASKKNWENLTPGMVYCAWITESKIPQLLELDYDFGWLCGIYLAEGSLDINTIAIAGTLNSVQDNVIRIAHKYNILGVDVSGSDKTFTSISSKVLRTLFLKLFGKGSNNKRIHPKLWNAHKDYIIGLISGYLDGDGHIHKDLTRISAMSTSKGLLQDIQQLLLHFDVKCSIIIESELSRIKNLEKFKNPKLRYNMVISKQGRLQLKNILRLVVDHKRECLSQTTESFPKPTAETINDVFLDPIISINEVPNNGKVYDLTVQDTRNFNLLSGLCIRDTFHSTGISSKKVVMGIPRQKEIVDRSRDIKAPSMKITPIPDFKYDKDTVTKLSKTLCYRSCSDFVLEYNVIKETPLWMTKIIQFLELPVFSTWKLHLKISNTIFDYGIDCWTLAENIQNKLPSSMCFGTNRDEESQHVIIYFIEDKKSGSVLTKDFVDKNKKSIIKRIDAVGIKGITDVYVNNEVEFIKTPDSITRKDYYTIDTDGINMHGVLYLDWVDHLKTTCNHQDIMASRYGIEAGLQVTESELSNIINSDGAYVNSRHMQLFADATSKEGVGRSITRHGMNKSSTAGFLAKASNEEPDKVICNSAINGESDNLNGVSGQVMLGKLATVGTGNIKVVLDNTTNIGKGSKRTMSDKELKNSIEILEYLDNEDNLEESSDEDDDSIIFNY